MTNTQIFVLKFRSEYFIIIKHQYRVWQQRWERILTNGMLNLSALVVQTSTVISAKILSICGIMASYVIRSGMIVKAKLTTYYKKKKEKKKKALLVQKQLMLPGNCAAVPEVQFLSLKLPIPYVVIALADQNLDATWKKESNCCPTTSFTFLQSKGCVSGLIYRPKKNVDRLHEAEFVRANKQLFVLFMLFIWIVAINDRAAKSAPSKRLHLFSRMLNCT